MEKKNEMTTYERLAMDRINILIAEYCDGSQQRFCERTGLNKGSVSQYVNGKNIPSNITASKIAGAFNINPAWLMGFDVPMERTVVTPTVPSGSSLRPDELALLDKYNKLNSVGREKVVEYVSDLAENERYIKDTESKIG